MFYYRTKIILLLYKSEKVIDSLEVLAKKFTLRSALSKKFIKLERLIYYYLVVKVKGYLYTDVKNYKFSLKTYFVKENSSSSVHKSIHTSHHKSFKLCCICNTYICIITFWESTRNKRPMSIINFWHRNILLIVVKILIRILGKLLIINLSYGILDR